MTEIFVKSEYLQELVEIFKKYCPDAEIWAYGSRVNGDAHDGSDLDIAVKSLGDSIFSLYEIREIIKDSNIPFLIDILELDSLPDSFKAEIERKHVLIYKGGTEL